MNQLTFSSVFAKAPRLRLRAIVEAVMANLVIAAVVVAALAACIAWRVVAAALANRELMEALRFALRRIAEAIGMVG
jgi:hypothetical protein